MNVHAQRMLVTAALTLVSTVALIGDAQAGARPDDRAGTLGAGSNVTRAVIRPNDRAGRLGVGADTSASTVATPDAFERAVLRAEMPPRPDDRGGFHGISVPGDVAAPVAAIAS